MKRSTKVFLTLAAVSFFAWGVQVMIELSAMETRLAISENRLTASENRAVCHTIPVLMPDGRATTACAP